MKHLLLSSFCSVIAAVPAFAQSALTPVSVLVQRYDEIVDSTGDAGLACCAPSILESGPGSDFLHVRMVFDVAFSDTLDRVSINSSDILLMLPGAAEGLRALGHYDTVGVFDRGASSLFVRRPREWPAETAQAFIDSVWLVPDGVTAATLKVGEEGAQIAVPVDLNVVLSQPISPGHTVEVAVTGFGVETGLALTDRVNGQELTGRVVPGAGQAVRLQVTVTPRMSTATDAQAGENRHLMFADYLSLVGPEGLPMPFLGYRTSDGLRRSWSVSSNWETSPRPSDLTLFYLGNPEPGTYTVYYLQDAVAQFNLE